MKPRYQGPTFTESHNKIIKLLTENGRTSFIGGIQLFADQYDTEWSISVNYNGTGLKISRSEIDELELIDDELIKVYKSWTYREKE